MRSVGGSSAWAELANGAERMAQTLNFISLKKLAAALSVTVLAACATPAPPPPPPAPPPPPPPPVVEAVPYRPIPPGGAPYAVSLPVKGADGYRVRMNRDLSAHDALWHFRSAWNVAALNCTGVEHQPIVDGYAAFIKKYDPALDRANAAIDQRYRSEKGGRTQGIRAREEFMTQLYNYLAMPPARSGFCTTALEVASEFVTNAPDDIATVSATNLERFDAVLHRFFDDYEQYQIASAEWDAKYGALYGASQPGYLAVHGAGGPALAANTTDPARQNLNAVIDPETGARIPVSPGTEATFATPVVQPLPTN